jgi:hypothetical protein
MKRFKELREELLSEGGGDMMPADDMTISELKIACYAANNILERLENGAMIQRWQISAIVKAKEELASVYTSISADEDNDDEYDDEWDMEDEEEPMYVGFEYPSMYGEATEVGKAGPAKLVSYGPKGDKVTASKIAGHIAKRANDYTGGNAELVKKLSSEVAKHGDTTANELIGKHKIIAKNIGMDAKAAHNLISGAASALKEEVELDEAMYIKTTPGQLEKAADKVGATWDKEKNAYIKNGLQVGYTKLKSKPGEARSYDHFIHRKLKEEADYKVTVDGLPDMYIKADNPSEVKANLRKVVKNPEMIRNVERIAKSSLQKMFRDKAAGKEEVTEGYNDPIHRKYISDTVHDYVAKDDPKHDKIVDHLHKAKNFGSKTVDSLSDHAGISYGAAKSITKDVASNLKANFGTAQKTQTQAQRVNAYLKQKQIGPRSKK